MLLQLLNETTIYFVLLLTPFILYILLANIFVIYKHSNALGKSVYQGSKTTVKELGFVLIIYYLMVLQRFNELPGIFFIVNFFLTCFVLHDVLAGFTKLRKRKINTEKSF